MSAPVPPPKADNGSAAGSQSAAASSATKGKQKQTSPRPGTPEPVPGESRAVDVPTDVAIVENAARLRKLDRAGAILYVIQRFLAGQGVSGGPSRGLDLFPPEWKVGRTPIPVADENGRILRQIARALPTLRAYDSQGREVHWVEEGRDMSDVVRLTAQWDAPVEIIARMLSVLKRADVSKDDVLTVAEKSPQALEALKSSGAELKAHFLRYLDPVALRRSPEFNSVAQRYKRQLRAAIDEQQRLIREARAATRRVNQILGERDEALAALDPGYVPKRATAATALRQFGIDLGEALDARDPEGQTASGVLEDLDF